jgi:hypothetical protein
MVAGGGSASGGLLVEWDGERYKEGTALNEFLIDEWGREPEWLIPSAIVRAPLLQW